MSKLPPTSTDSGQWIAELASLSPTIARIAQAKPVPTVRYQDAASGEMLEAEAFNLANDIDHNQAFARCFDGLSGNGASDAILQTYLGTLTNGWNTYGTASELLTYLWLLDHHVYFDIQIALTGADILNPNGSDLDGKLTFSSDVYWSSQDFVDTL
jgi:hypothetical protein